MGETWDSYSDGYLVEASSDKTRASHLDVTSGELYAIHVSSSYLRGWTETYNFRVLAVGDDGGGDKVRWTDGEVSYRGYIWNWHSGVSTTSGLHVFLRYQTEYDLYVASLRYDGLVTIKKKACGAYTTLASAHFGTPATRTWYTLGFVAHGANLDFYVDGSLVLSTVDHTFSWGTYGIRTDYMDVYFDDWSVSY